METEHPEVEGGDWGSAALGCGQWLASTAVLCELSRAFQKWWVPCQDRLTLPAPFCPKAACRIPFIFSVGLSVPIPGSGDRSR